MRKTILVLVACVLALAAPAWAVDPFEAVGRANTSLNAGDYGGTVFHLREALQEVWNQAPLLAQNVHFVTDQPEAYGMYKPRANNVFDAVDPILLYCEPVGYTVKRSGDIYSIAISADFSIVDSKGVVIGGQQNFGRWTMRSRAFNTEFMMYFTFNLRGLPAGQYRLLVTLNDQNSDKKADFEQPFVIR